MNVKSKTIIQITIIMLLLSLGQCKTGIGGPDTLGLFYSDVTHSESRDTVIGSRKGETCQVSFLSLFAAGDNSIPEAANNGAIREVNNIAFRSQGILFGLLWAKNCTIVYGR